VPRHPLLRKWIGLCLPEKPRSLTVETVYLVHSPPFLSKEPAPSAEQLVAEYATVFSDYVVTDPFNGQTSMVSGTELFEQLQVEFPVLTATASNTVLASAHGFALTLGSVFYFRWLLPRPEARTSTDAMDFVQVRESDDHDAGDVVLSILGWNGPEADITCML
jgi:hypothetical protein